MSYDASRFGIMENGRFGAGLGLPSLLVMVSRLNLYIITIV